MISMVFLAMSAIVWRQPSCGDVAATHHFDFMSPVSVTR